ncbi:MAG: toxin-antitoxin system, antitoxin component, Xre family protein [Clostridiales bacterium]|nr:toxin-antitoxin system, antitoxin component, Xre family protein [Clostridiales bacterium]
MFNRNKFKATVLLNGASMQYVADIMGISLATLYRKMNGESDFTRNEIQMYRKAFNLTSEECDAIFFED